MASQNIVVVGGGAMGSIFAAGIAQAGHDVVVLDVAADLVDAINAHGLSVESRDAKVVTMVPATTHPHCLNAADAALVFVKAHHTAAVAQALGAHRGQSTAVVTLQNGWGNAERLAETVPVDHLVMGVTYHSGTVASAASVAHTGRGPTFVGPYQVGGDVTLAEEVSTILSGSGFDALCHERYPYPDMEQAGAQCGHPSCSRDDRVKGGRDARLAGGRHFGGGIGRRSIVGGLKNGAQRGPGREAGENQGGTRRRRDGQAFDAAGHRSPA